MNFVADKYDPSNDPYYPKVGDMIDEGKKVKKAQHIEAKDLMKLLTSKDLPEDAEHLIIVDNPDRPFLKYLVWWETI